MDTTLQKGLRLLEALSASGTPRGVADLARELDLTRSNAFRLLGSLVALGYAGKDPESGRYVATLRGWEFGARVLGRLAPRRVAQPYLRSLHGETGKNVFLSMIDGGDILYVEKVEAVASTLVSAQPGDRLPAVLVASGHVLLAHLDLDADALADLLAAHPSGTTPDGASMRADLARVRLRGWSCTRDGSRPGVTSIAAPVWDAGTVPVAAIAVSGPNAELPEARHQAVADSVMRITASLSAALGARV